MGNPFQPRRGQPCRSYRCRWKFKLKIKSGATTAPTMRTRQLRGRTGVMNGNNRLTLYRKRFLGVRDRGLCDLSTQSQNYLLNPQYFHSQTRVLIPPHKPVIIAFASVYFCTYSFPHQFTDSFMQSRACNQVNSMVPSGSFFPRPETCHLDTAHSSPAITGMDGLRSIN